MSRKKSRHDTVTIDTPSDSSAKPFIIKDGVRKKIKTSKTEEASSPKLKGDRKVPRKLLEFGNFDRGDRVARIEPYQISEDESERVFRIFWKQRRDGVQPRPSFADYDELKHQTPFKIIQWWEGMWIEVKKWMKDHPHAINVYKPAEPATEQPQSVIEEMLQEIQKPDLSNEATEVPKAPSKPAKNVALFDDLMGIASQLHNGEFSIEA